MASYASLAQTPRSPRPDFTARIGPMGCLDRIGPHHRNGRLALQSIVRIDRIDRINRIARIVSQSVDHFGRVVRIDRLICLNHIGRDRPPRSP